MYSFQMKCGLEYGFKQQTKVFLEEYSDSLFLPKSVLLPLLWSKRVSITQALISENLFNPTV